MKIRKLLLILCILAAAICAAVVIGVLNSREKSRQRDEELARTALTTESDASASDIREGSARETNTTLFSEEIPKYVYNSPVDFDWLKSINSEITSWLVLDNTDINYPVAQHEDVSDRDFYLNMGYDLKADQTGTLYTIPNDASEYVRIVYGHNQSRFAELKRYNEDGYWEGHNRITLYLPEAEYEYSVFAAAKVNDRLITDLYDLKTRDGRQTFLDSILAEEGDTSHIFGSCSADDEMIILSTCVPGQTDNRFIVVGVLDDLP